MNRQITSRIASCHFAPTPLSKQNLLNEGVSEERIVVTGNTVIDALHWVTQRIKPMENSARRYTKTLIRNGLPEKVVKGVAPAWY